MSITTRQGDNGETSLLFGQRIAKSHPRIHALGAVDELNAALGLLRATARKKETGQITAQVQRWLFTLMGELATPPGQEEKHARTHPDHIDSAKIGALDRWIARLEKAGCLQFQGWALPGEAGVLGGAHADLARAICRRAERQVADLEQARLAVRNEEIPRFLNRLSDLLWLIARWEEKPEAAGGEVGLDWEV